MLRIAIVPVLVAAGTFFAFSGLSMGFVWHKDEIAIPLWAPTAVIVAILLALRTFRPVSGIRPNLCRMVIVACLVAVTEVVFLGALSDARFGYLVRGLGDLRGFGELKLGILKRDLRASFYFLCDGRLALKYGFSESFGRFEVSAFYVVTLSLDLPAETIVSGISIRTPWWFASGLLVIYPTVAFLRGPGRRWLRCRRGLCVKCGYDLMGNVSGVCPECGSACQAPPGAKDG